MKQSGQRCFLLLALTAAVAVFIWYSWRNFVPHVGSTGHYHGGVDGELDSYVSGLNFAHCGFARLHFLPHTRQYEEDCQFSFAPYTHLLIGPQLVSGVLQRLGARHFSAQRLVLYGVSFLTIWFWWGICRRLAPDDGCTRTVGVIGLALILASPWLIFWAGNLYTWTYWDFFAAVGIWLLLTDRNRSYGIWMFIGTFFDYALVPFLFVLGAFRIYQNWRCSQSSWKKSATYVLLYGLAPLCAMTVMFMLNVSYWGSVSRAVQDLTDRVAMRTGWSGQYVIVAHMAKFAFTSLWYYGLSVLLLMLVGIRQCIRRKLAWPVVVLAAGFLWQCLFRNHSYIHAFTARLVGPGVFLCAAVGAAALLADRRRGLRVCGFALILLGVLRLPLGAEVSRNPIGLRFWQWAVRSSGSATLLSTLNTARTTTEHGQEKRILIDELVRRAGVAGDQEAYELVGAGKRFVLAKLNYGRLLEAFHLPADVTSDFVVDGPVYSDHKFAITNLATSPVKIRIDGKPDKIRAAFLSLYLHLI